MYLKKIFMALIIGFSSLLYADDEAKVYYGLSGNINSVKVGEYEPVDNQHQLVYAYQAFFNDENQVTEIIYFDEDDKFLSKSISERNDSGQEVASTTYDEQQKLLTKAKITLDANGWSNMVLITDANDNFISKATFENNKDGYRTVVTSLDEDGSIKRIIKNKYDNNNFKIQSDYYEGSGEKILSEIFVNDENGNPLTKTENTYTNGKPDQTYQITYQYKFDDKGNWIEQMGYEDGKLDTITKKQIEYR